MPLFCLKMIFPTIISKYTPLITVLISRQKLLENLRAYQKRYSKVQFAPVLKSNAYGHGLVEVAKILDSEKLPFLVVDSIFEATVLRRREIKTKILIIGFVLPRDIIGSRLPNVSFAVTSLDQLKLLAGKGATLHLKIDTGMHRQGIMPSEITSAIKFFKANKNLVLEGVCSHFPDADGDSETFTKNQIGEWNNIVKIFRKEFTSIKYFHLANTAGAKFSELIDANVARLGFGLYEEVLEMRTVIGSVRTVLAGGSVGYDLTFKTKKKTKLACVPVGYYEGVDRRLSNSGSFIVGDVVCPVVGRVSMNITSIDVTKVPNVKMGDAVTVISANKNDPNSAENVAHLAKTIPYEILVHISSGLRRTVVK